MINIVETLELIIDTKDKTFDRRAFAKKTGIKCDSVGWMCIDIRKDMEQLKQIRELANKMDLKLRGTYEKKINDTNAKWYRFSPRYHFAMSDYSYVQERGDYYYYKIKAYKAPKGCNMIDSYVSQRFVDSYHELKLTGLDFIWEPDSGKYQADSFYKPIFLNKAERFIYPGQMNHLNKKTYDFNTMNLVSEQYDFSALREYYAQVDFPEGKLCEIEKYMDNLDVVLPLALEYDSMPDTDFAYCFLKGYVVINLIRENALQKMINAGVVNKNDFEPVVCINPKEQALLVQKGDEYEDFHIMIDNKSHFEELRVKLAAKNRPEFVPSEKEVLALLKKNKKNYSEFFNRPIKKGLLEEAQNSLFSALVPYYKVACGGRLAEDTYEYFCYETAKQKNDIWHKEFDENKKQLESNKLLEESVVFGATCNDNYLLLHGQQVYEVSCHTYEIVKQWNDVYLFFYENVMG